MRFSLIYNNIFQNVQDNLCSGMTIWCRPRILNFENWGHSGKVTKRHQGQLVVKNTLKVDIGLRAS